MILQFCSWALGQSHWNQRSPRVQWWNMLLKLRANLSSSFYFHKWYVCIIVYLCSAYCKVIAAWLARNMPAVEIPNAILMSDWALHWNLRGWPFNPAFFRHPTFRSSSAAAKSCKSVESPEAQKHLQRPKTKKPGKENIIKTTAHEKALSVTRCAR